MTLLRQGFVGQGALDQLVQKFGPLPRPVRWRIRRTLTLIFVISKESTIVFNRVFGRVAGHRPRRIGAADHARAMARIRIFGK